MFFISKACLNTVCLTICFCCPSLPIQRPDDSRSTWSWSSTHRDARASQSCTKTIHTVYLIFSNLPTMYSNQTQEKTYVVFQDTITVSQTAPLSPCLMTQWPGLWWSGLADLWALKNKTLSHTRVVAIQRTGERCSSSILVRAIMVSAMAFLVTLDQASERWP